MQDGEGRAQFARYATDASPAGKGNRLALASKLQNTVGNILTQGSFESGSPWDGASIASGTAYYGSKSLQLLSADAAAVQGPAFIAQPGESYTFSAWTGNFILATVPSAAPQLDSRVLKFIGDPADEKQLQQIIQISGSAGDTFVLAGWAKGDAAPYLPEDNTREFSLQLLFHNADGSTFCADPIRFNPDVDSSVSWQYASAPLVAPKDYSSLEVRILYHHNVNSVYFDGIQRIKKLNTSKHQHLPPYI